MSQVIFPSSGVHGLKRGTPILAILIIVAVATFATSCFNKQNGAKQSLGAESGLILAASVPLSSQAFAREDAIPSEFTCDGADSSPDLEWTGIPSNTKSLVIIFDDPDAPGRTFTHWILYNLPPTAASIPKDAARTGQLPAGCQEGRNDFGKVGYGGPCPPRGSRHRYFFRLYALDAKLETPDGAARSEVVKAMKPHIIGMGELMGTYSRK